MVYVNMLYIALRPINVLVRRTRNQLTNGHMAYSPNTLSLLFFLGFNFKKPYKNVFLIKLKNVAEKKIKI